MLPLTSGAAFERKTGVSAQLGAFLRMGDGSGTVSFGVEVEVAT